MDRTLRLHITGIALALLVALAGCGDDGSSSGGGGSGGGGGAGGGGVTLPEVTVSATDATAAEPGTNTGTFTFTRTGSTASALTVLYAVTGTATSGTDYLVIGTSVAIPAGSATATLVVTPIDNATAESDETVVVTLLSSPPYAIGTPNVATVVIQDDDASTTRPTVTVSATDATASEPGTNTGTLTFTRTGATTAALTVNFTVAGTAATGSDYTSIGTSVTFAVGSASATKTVTPIDDTSVEVDETVIVSLSTNAAYLVGTPGAATVTIQDNDTSTALPTVTVSATDATASEPGTNTGTFTFTRTGATTAALTVNYSVAGTASSGTDYTSIGTSVTIAAGSASATKIVTPVDNTTAESDETVVVTLAANAAYSVGIPGAATITIQDNDTSTTLPTVTVSATDATASEPGSNTGTFTFTRTGATTAALTATFTVAGTATSGSDYTSIGASVTIAAGSTSATKVVTPIDNTTPESDETVIVTITANAAYTVGTPAAATVTIQDNDTSTTVPTVTVSATDPIASEAGTNTGAFTVTRTGATTAALTVNVTVTGTATSGSDFSSIGTSVTIAAGSASATRTVTPIDDTASEPDETVILTLTPNAAYTVGSPSSATVTIQDNDGLTGIRGPTFTAEGPVTFTLSGGMSGVWTVDREEEVEVTAEPITITRFTNVFPSQSGPSATYTLNKTLGKGTAFLIKANAGGTLYTHRVHVFEIGTLSTFVYDKNAFHPDIRVWVVIPHARLSECHQITIMHGNGRGARGYLNPWRTWSVANNYAAYAPEFSEADYTGEEYHRGGVVIGSTLQAESRWVFTMVEDLQRYMLAEFKATDTKVDMWGHSAGGQFVHRFSFFKPNAPVRYYIPANAGYYTTPEFSAGGACAFPYSLWHSTFSYTTSDLMRWTSKPVIIMRGTEDTDPNDPDLARGTCPDKQGLHRYARAGHFYSKGRAVGNPSFGWHLKDVQNVGHSATGMSQSPDGAQKILENPAAFGVPVLSLR